MTTRNKQSVFAAFKQLSVGNDVESDDGSAEERQMKRKEKQKEKKKLLNRKKSSDMAQLKDLAFVSVSKPKKSKGKNSKLARSNSKLVDSGTSEETLEELKRLGNDTNNDDEKVRQRLAPNSNDTDVTVLKNGIDKKPQPAAQQQHEKSLEQQQRHRNQQYQTIGTPHVSIAVSATSQPQSDMEKDVVFSNSASEQQHPQRVGPPPVRNTDPRAACAPQSSLDTELGAVYSPTHIMIMRKDGQMKRTVAVTDVMDQLLRYTQQNAQLLMVQEQLGHTNRSLQDQLQRSAEMINGLQNEVTMFRQMCLNLQAEVSLLRSNSTPMVSNGNDSPNLPHYHRPPPGMS